MYFWPKQQHYSLIGKQSHSNMNEKHIQLRQSLNRLCVLLIKYKTEQHKCVYLEIRTI